MELIIRKQSLNNQKREDVKINLFGDDDEIIIKMINEMYFIPREAFVGVLNKKYKNKK